MLRSREMIGVIAALAKAQAELTNPEKSLIGRFALGPARDNSAFRYAALSSGLDIVRRVLCGREIAMVQTIAGDMDMGLIRHASG